MLVEGSGFWVPEARTRPKEMHCATLAGWAHGQRPRCKSESQSGRRSASGGDAAIGLSLRLCCVLTGFEIARDSTARRAQANGLLVDAAMAARQISMMPTHTYMHTRLLPIATPPALGPISSLAAHPKQAPCVFQTVCGAHDEELCARVPVCSRSDRNFRFCLAGRHRGVHQPLLWPSHVALLHV